MPMNVASFKGLNNVTDPMRLGMDTLVQADNVNITDTGSITKRNGYTLHTAGNVASAYSTLNYSRAYLIEGNTIKTIGGVQIGSILDASSEMYWCEVNDDVYFNNGIDSGVIKPDHEILPWRESTLEDLKFLDAAGNELDSLLATLPVGTDVIQYWKGRMYAAQYMASEDQTVIWFSRPLGYHLFNLDTDFVMVQGQVLMLAPHDSALIIGADDAVYAYDGTSLAQIADYGVVPGQHWSSDESRVLFWSRRGLCAALPFQNLTEQVSVAPGVRAGGCVVRAGGQRRYLSVIQQGDSPFNAY